MTNTFLLSAFDRTTFGEPLELDAVLVAHTDMRLADFLMEQGYHLEGITGVPRRKEIHQDWALRDVWADGNQFDTLTTEIFCDTLASFGWTTQHLDVQGNQTVGEVAEAMRRWPRAFESTSAAVARQVLGYRPKGDDVRRDWMTLMFAVLVSINTHRHAEVIDIERLLDIDASTEELMSYILNGVVGPKRIRMAIENGVPADIAASTSPA